MRYEVLMGRSKEMGVDEVIREIRKYPCKSVSITGGEPLLQREEVLELVKKLKKNGLLDTDKH